jgi:hypothetical protein
MSLILKVLTGWLLLRNSTLVKTELVGSQQGFVDKPLDINLIFQK